MKLGSPPLLKFVPTSNCCKGRRVVVIHFCRFAPKPLSGMGNDSMSCSRVMRLDALAGLAAMLSTMHIDRTSHVSALLTFAGEPTIKAHSAALSS
jgi:hypothetical protein